ncbi:hypothetical protein [Saccharothrix coeruleofusca]|uniref:Uncharacterized protein n=1 Tax=Saccharothrix coeruleofusca TaxID=33919 RepID=A0A918EFN0_9PSEU|nr:hypothetical protein [Saccharothrix coeruleofusca]GGP74509.1 hypothetical protein GCM10010185_55120 [Saccharothrix coeruleofusca]
MSESMQRTAAQWALPCLLFLGMIGMHHVNVDIEMPAGHVAMTSTTSPHGHAPDRPGPSPAHEVLHLCMAILGTAVSLLLLGWLLLRVMRPDQSRVPIRPGLLRAPQRSPPLGGRTLLDSSCVLRL